MTKKDKLEKLDRLLLDKMISLVEAGTPEKLDELSLLSTPMNYLRNNQVVAEKPKSTVEEDVKKRLQAAKNRRAKKEDK